MGSEFLRVQRILHQIRQTKDETKTIAEVSRIKPILDDDKSEVGAVRALLLKLKQMAVSMKVLEVTMIGKSVSILQSHASKDIRQTARTLIRAWRLTVDEWMVVNDHSLPEEECSESNKINPPIEKQQGRPPLVPRKFNIENPKRRSTTPCASLETKKLQNPTKSIVLEKKLSVEEKRSYPCASFETKRLQNPRKSIVLDKKLSVEEKLEASKRKLEEGYKEAHNAKRLRRTQVIEVGDVLRLGLVPKHQHSNRRMRPCVGLVRSNKLSVY